MHLICAILGHGHSDRVWHDGLDFRADCRRCGTPMVKDAFDRAWRAFDDVADASPHRRPKPGMEVTAA